jgi:predicted transcriptional regulator
VAVMKEEDYLAHYGILRKSGRYPWGSGGTQSQRNKAFLDTVADLRRQGLTDVEICKGFSTDEHKFTTTQLRAAETIAKNEQKQAQINMAQRLQDKGMSNVAIGQRMGLNESSVRALLAPGRKDKIDQLNSIAEMLRRQVDEKQFVDIGVGVERALPLATDTAAAIGIPKDKFQTAVAMLREEGYEVHTLKIPQLGTRDKTTLKVLAPPGTDQRTVWENRENIRQINEQTKDNGRTILGIQPPLSISSKRVGIRYGDEGGSENDGVLFVRPGVKDVSIGASQYAQVRVAVDGTHYIKGMAVYKDDLPAGVDIVFNTNKKNTGNKLDALKELKRDADGNVDMDNPFGAVIKQGGQILEQRGNKTVVTSSMNILREEGDWDKYSKSLSSQMLSKQTPDLAKRQLDFTFERRQREFAEISALTNPAVKKKLLASFADATDSAAIHLKAAGIPNQASKVLMPVPSMKPTEVYAPSYRNGQRIALVRFPHGGTFEIPVLTVNNRNPEAKKLLGTSAKDAIGIHHSVAEHLSGADFDGDHVITIPNDKGLIKTSPALEGLKNFDPKHSYPKYEGMIPIDAVKGRDQVEMGKITNLIADMTIKGANSQELARAVRHSMVVIDAKKHELDYKGSYQANGIAQLKEKYQGSSRAGASTLITKATSEARPLEKRLRKASEGGPIDKATGKLVYVPTGATTTDRKGNVIPKTMRSVKLKETDDAHTLSSGTAIETLYADHSNRLKDLANQARKTYVNTEAFRYEPSAKKTYAPQVESLEMKLNRALRNAPLERQAQVLANAVVAQKRRDYPDMEPEDLRKIKNQALAEMRVRTGAKKERVDITQEEWNAIQAGAITNHKLEQILTNTDIERVKELATPKQAVLMTNTATSRARTMLASGYTQAEVAEQLGVSLTTLKTGLSE